MTLPPASSLTASPAPNTDETQGAEQRYRALFEQSPLSIQIFAPDGRTLAVNRAWETLWGLTADALADYNVLHDAQLEQKGILPYIRRGFAGEACAIPAVAYDPGQPVPFERVRWVRAFIQPVKDAAGTVGEVVLFHEDVTESKRAENNLRASEDRLERVLETNADGILIADKDGRMVFANQAAERILGLTRDAITHRTYRDPELKTTFLDGTPIPPDQSPTARALFGGETVRDFPVAFERPGGGPRAVLRLNAAPLTDAAGNVSGAVTSLSDMTHQTLAELALVESEHRLRFLADAMPQIVWTARPDGALDYYNQRWYEYTGLTFEQTQGWGWQPVLHPNDVGPCTERWTRSYTTGEPYQTEYRFRRASDGAYRWHLGRALPQRDPATGTIVRWVGTCTDIDDQKRAAEAAHASEAALRESEERSRLVVDTALDAVVAMDAEGRITRWNAQSEVTFGWTANEAVGRLMADLIIPHQYRDAHWSGLAKFLETGTGPVLNQRIEITALNRNGDEFPVELAISPLKTGEAISFSAFIRDITARKQAENDLRASAQENARLLDEVQQNARRQRAFLADVLRAVTEGRLRLCETEADLPVLAAPIGDPVALTAHTLRALRRTVRQAADLAALPDERWQDLLTSAGEATMNAVVHAGENNGEARVLADTIGGTVQVWVRDHGPGIPIERLHRATLERGYTTAGTMGHGFWLMLKTCDRVYLLTGPTGTTVVLEQARIPPEPEWLTRDDDALIGVA